MTAAAAVVEQVDHDSVARFLDIIEQCPGQLLTSGIGEEEFSSWQCCLLLVLCFLSGI